MRRATLCAVVLGLCGCATMRAAEPPPKPIPGLPVPTVELQAMASMAPKDLAREVTRLMAVRGFALVGGAGEQGARVLTYRGVLSAWRPVMLYSHEVTAQFHARLEAVPSGTRLTLYGERVFERQPLCNDGPRPAWVPPQECNYGPQQYTSGAVEDTVKGVLFELAELGPAPR